MYQINSEESKAVRILGARYRILNYARRMTTEETEMMPGPEQRTERKIFWSLCNDNIRQASAISE